MIERRRREYRGAEDAEGVGCGGFVPVSTGFLSVRFLYYGGCVPGFSEGSGLLYANHLGNDERWSLGYNKLLIQAFDWNNSQ